MQATKAPLTAPSFPKPTRTRWCRSSRRSDLPQETVMATPSPAAKKSFQWKPRWLWWTLLVLLLLGAIVGFTAWYKIFREEPQPDWVTATPEMRRSEEHTSELQSLMRISYAVFCLKKKNNNMYNIITSQTNCTAYT